MKSYKTLILAVVVFSSATIFLTNCGPQPDDTIIIDDPVTDEPQDYTDHSHINAVHVVGDTSCPQDLGFVFIHSTGIDDLNNTITDIDSVSLENSHGSLNAFFGNPGTTNSGFDSTGVLQMTLQFNCAKAESVDAMVKCNFYANKSMVSSEEVSVKVEVKE